MNGAPSHDFNAFMAYVNECYPGYVGHLYARYTSCSGAHILKNEALAEDLARFRASTRLAVDAEGVLSAPKVGISPAIDLEWDPRVLAKTVALEAATFQQYGYDAA